MITNMVVSRSRRILNAFKHYRVGNSDDVKKFGLMARLDPTEQLIGIYANPSGVTPSEVFVTTERVCFWGEDNVFDDVAYKEICDVTTGKEGKVSCKVVITRNDGSSCVLRMAGGEGRFRDSLEFTRFLLRAREDIKRKNDG